MKIDDMKFLKLKQAWCHLVRIHWLFGGSAVDTMKFIYWHIHGWCEGAKKAECLIIKQITG